jgi:hypothetical protein
MFFDVNHFRDPTNILISLSQGAACAFGSPGALRENRHAADKYVREMGRLYRTIKERDWVPVPPPDADLFVPAPNHTWMPADGPAWRRAFLQTIADLDAPGDTSTER